MLDFLIEGFTQLTIPQVAMWLIGGLLIYLAIKKDMEPALLLPMGFGAILVNLPLSPVIKEGSGIISSLFAVGIEASEAMPLLLFIGIGAMIDFGPLLTNPKLFILGGAAQFGIFITVLFAAMIGFPLTDAASIGIIGAADGPTAIHVANTLDSQYLSAIVVVAYSYMALVPIVQPIVIKMCTTKKERMIRMQYASGEISQATRIMFPIIVTIISGLIAPESLSLVGMLMFGNLIRECGVLKSLSDTAQTVFANIITLLLGITIAFQMQADKFLRIETLAICPTCGYKANMEAADCLVKNEAGEIAPLTKVHTPNAKTIEEVVNFLGTDAKKLCKAVVYQKNEDDSYIIVFIRGDLEVNETKLRNYLGYEIHPAAVITEESGIVAGFIGAIDLDKKIKTVWDKSLVGIESLVCGANETDYHYTGMNVARDIGEVEYVDVAKIYAGAFCPVCGQPVIEINKGIEVGNIFQLGTKYTKSMDMTYLDSDGTLKYPIMGCYGIGVGRLCASICQESHDKFGPIWPMPIAPWHVEVCNLRSDDETVNNTANALYEKLLDLGVEVLYDDRNIRPGAMFADADLLGVPVRAVVSPKTCEKGVVEVSFRDKSFKGEFAIEEAAEKIKEIIQTELAKFN